MKRFIILFSLFLPGLISGQSTLRNGMGTYWNCDESNTVVADNVGSLNGTAHNMDRPSGKIGNCLLFDSGNDYVSLTSTLQIGVSNATVAFWINLTSIPGDNLIMGDNLYYSRIYIGSTNNTKWETITDGQEFANYTTYNTGTWYHVAITKNGNDFKYYRNGTYIDGSTISGSQPINISQLGYQNGSIRGYLDEIGIWSRALTAAEIDTLYNGPDGTGAEGYTYPFSTSTPPPSGAGIGRVIVQHSNKMSIVQHSIKRNILLNKSEVISNDTLQYFLQERFTNWTTNTLRIDSLTKRWPWHSTQYDEANQSIINDGSPQGNCWQSFQHTSTMGNLAINILLGDSMSDAWFANKVYVDPNFQTSINPPHSSKISTGFEMGDNNMTCAEFATDAGYPGAVPCTPYLDTINHIHGRVGRGHDVNSSYGWTGYAYVQSSLQWGTDWTDGITDPAHGVYPFSGNLGRWIHHMCHVYVGTPGHYDGFLEIYWDGILTAQYTGLKFRSISQGIDNGKITEAVMSYFFNNNPSPRDNFVRFDDLVIFKYKPSANNYHYGQPRSIGTRISQVSPIVNEQKPINVLINETYTHDADTIYDVGENHSYMDWPPYQGGTEIITKVVNVTGTINYAPLYPVQWGYGYDGNTNEGFTIKVYNGIGTGGTLLHTFGRDPGTESFIGTYSHAGPITFAIHTGWHSGNTFGVAIRYWK